MQTSVKTLQVPPPDGFQPLNLSTVQPENVIARPDQYVGATIYDSNNSTSRSISTGHKPDLIWCKSRNYEITVTQYMIL